MSFDLGAGGQGFFANAVGVLTRYRNVLAKHVDQSEWVCGRWDIVDIELIELLGQVKDGIELTGEDRQLIISQFQ